MVEVLGSGIILGTVVTTLIGLLVVLIYSYFYGFYRRYRLSVPMG